MASSSQDRGSKPIRSKGHQWRHLELARPLGLPRLLVTVHPPRAPPGAASATDAMMTIVAPRFWQEHPLCHPTASFWTQAARLLISKQETFWMAIQARTYPYRSTLTPYRWWVMYLPEIVTQTFLPKYWVSLSEPWGRPVILGHPWSTWTLPPPASSPYPQQQGMIY